VLQRGAAVFALGGLLQWVLCVVWPVHSPYAFVLPMAVLTMGWGMVQPQVQAVTLAIAPALVGRGSALLGVIQLGTGGLVAWVVSHYVDGTPTLTATLLAVGGLGSLGCAAATAALSRRGAVLGR
jgi:DHA1 family bicyclomycin/chloramphenicol resistance-like MFS transporter